MLQETVAKLAQYCRNTLAQPLASPLSSLMGCRAPALNDRRTRLAVHGFEARSVPQEPKGREVGIELLGEDEVDIGLNIGRARETGVVAQEAQLCTVGDDAPKRVIFRVQKLLHQSVRRAAPAFF